MGLLSRSSSLLTDRVAYLEDSDPFAAVFYASYPKNRDQQGGCISYDTIDNLKNATLIVDSDGYYLWIVSDVEEGMLEVTRGELKKHIENIVGGEYYSRFSGIEEDLEQAKEALGPGEIKQDLSEYTYNNIGCTRGPLYDRAEVIAWLEARNRLSVRAPEIEALWNLASSFRGELSTDDVMPLLLLLFAIKSKAPTAWQRLAASTPTLGDDVVRAAAHQMFPFSDDVLPSRPLPTHALQNAISMLDAFDATRAGELTDALLEQAATATGSRGGEFLTPRSVRNLMVALADLTGTVYNPATGVGQLLIDAASDTDRKVAQFYGQEINARIWAMAQLNLSIHDVDADVVLGDVFAEDRFPQLRADRVLCVPPWNQRLPMAEVLFDDPRWVFSEPGPNDGNAAWIQHCLAHLTEDGRAVIVLPNGALFGAGREGRIRQRIVKAGLLDAVFSLPGGLFAWTALPCAVLVLKKGRPSVKGRPASTLMVDLTDSQEPARTSALSTRVIDDAARLYRRWTQGKEPNNGQAAVATFDDIAARDFVIDPGRYLSLPLATIDLGEVNRHREELVDKLTLLTQQTHDADSRLHGLLKREAMTSTRDVRLGDLVPTTIRMTRGFPTQRAVEEGDVRVMSVAALRNAAPPRHFADRAAITESDLARPEDVLISIEGGTVGETLVVPDGLEKFVPSQQVATLRIHDWSRIDPWYLGAWFTSEPAAEQVRRLARGLGIQRIAMKDLSSLVVRVPPLAEQREIGERFQAFEAAIRSHRAVSACLEQLRDLDLVVTFAASDGPDVRGQS